MSRSRAHKEPEVKWAVTDQVLGGLTVGRVIDLHHFLRMTSNREVLELPLAAYKPPTEKDPFWVVQQSGGEIWRLQWRGRALGFLFEIWWGYEWRKRTRPPQWVRELGWSIEYGKRKRWEGGVEVAEPPALPAPNDEEQLTLF